VGQNRMTLRFDGASDHLCLTKTARQ
jgi:hypothetical protein